MLYRVAGHNVVGESLHRRRGQPAGEADTENGQGLWEVLGHALAAVDAAQRQCHTRERK